MDNVDGSANFQINSQRNLVPLTLICVIPSLVLGYLSLAAPTEITNQLEFWYSDPSLISIWGSSLIHFNISHFATNLLVYVSVIIPAYAVFLLRDQLRLFWWTGLSLAIATPPVVRGFDWLILAYHLELVAPTATARGFSGLVSAVGGMLLAASLLTLRDRYGTPYTIRVSFVIFCSLVSYTAVATPVLPTPVFIIGVLGAVEYIHRYIQSPQELPNRLKVAINTEPELTIALLAACGFLTAIIPTDPISNGIFSGVTAHIAGTGCGILLTSASIQLSEIAH